jgi:hypothetical protein
MDRFNRMLLKVIPAVFFILGAFAVDSTAGLLTWSDLWGLLLCTAGFAAMDIVYGEI